MDIATQRRLQRESLFAFGFVMWNVLSSVGLIIINKWLLDIIRLDCIMFLTALHLFSSWVPLAIMARTGYLQLVPMRFSENVKLCLSFFMTVAFFNVSLKFNSVGSYQLAKLLVTPATCVLQYVVDGTTVSLATALSLVVITVSVSWSTVMDVKLVPIGTGASIIAIGASSINSIWTKNKPNELKMAPAQMNFHIFPLTGLFFLVASFLFENNPIGQVLQIIAIDMGTAANMPVKKPSFSVTGAMLLTCVMAASLNNSSTKLIHYTSPITYHVVSHLKLVLILAFGVIFLSSPIDFGIGLGMCGAVGGVAAYTYIKQVETIALERARTEAQRAT